MGDILTPVFRIVPGSDDPIIFGLTGLVSMIEITTRQHVFGVGLRCRVKTNVKGDRVSTGLLPQVIEDKPKACVLHRVSWQCRNAISLRAVSL